MKKLLRKFSTNSSARFFLAACLFSLSLISCQTNPTSLARFEYTQPQMGLSFRIVLYARSETEATTASSAAFSRIKELNDILSDYDADSELNHLNVGGPPGHPGGLLKHNPPRP